MVKIKETIYQNGDKAHKQSRVVTSESWSEYLNNTIYKHNGATLYNPVLGEDRIIYEFEDAGTIFTHEAILI